MSAHYSKYKLNTYATTPYFRAHCPPGYPLDIVLVKARAFLRLPPRLRELSGLAKQWAMNNSEYPAGVEGIERWYDDAGHELNPDTGQPLTDAENDALWQDDGPNDFQVVDLPEGVQFADPDTWQPEESVEETASRSDLTEEIIFSEIQSHGRERVAEEYGIPADQLARLNDDRALAQAVLQMRGSQQ